MVVAVFPPCGLTWDKTMVGIMKRMTASFKNSSASTATSSATNPAAGHHQPTPPLKTTEHSQASLGQSLVGSQLLSPGSWCAQVFVCAHQESVSPVLCKFCNQIPLAYKFKFPGGSQFLCQTCKLGNILWVIEFCKNLSGIIVLQLMGHLLGGSMVGLMETSSNRAYVTCCVTQVWCTQSPCPWSRPLLTCISAGDTQTLKSSSCSISKAIPRKINAKRQNGCLRKPYR